MNSCHVYKTDKEYIIGRILKLKMGYGLPMNKFSGCQFRIKIAT